MRDTDEMARWRANTYWEVRQTLKALKMLQEEKRRAVSINRIEIHHSTLLGLSLTSVLSFSSIALLKNSKTRKGTVVYSPSGPSPSSKSDNILEDVCSLGAIYFWAP